MDAIDRQAAIEAVGYYSLHSGDKLLFADKPLKELPSIQPEKRTQERTETHACDLISRQAAIDDLQGKDPSQIWDTADIEVWINSLPSVQPEREYTMEEFMFGQDMGNPEDGSL